MQFAAILRWPAPLRRQVVAAAAAVVVVLAAAAHAVAQSQRAVAEVGSLVRALEMQLRLVYRDNLPEYSRRSEQLRAATTAWQESSRSAADHEQMAAWLRRSIRHSMPGSTSPLPPLPERASTLPVQEPLPPSVMRSRPVDAEMETMAEESPAPAQQQTAQPIAEPIDTEPLDGPHALDRHPAADQWPLELSEGDPFRDDPLPPEPR